MAFSSLKHYIDNLDFSTEDDDFKGINTSDTSKNEESNIECSSVSADSVMMI